MKIRYAAMVLGLTIVAAACGKKEEAPPVEETPAPAAAPAPDTSAAMDSSMMHMDTTSTTHM
jgi:hypothetical protein